MISEDEETYMTKAIAANWSYFIVQYLKHHLQFLVVRRFSCTKHSFQVNAILAKACAILKAYKHGVHSPKNISDVMS